MNKNKISYILLALLLAFSFIRFSNIFFKSFLNDGRFLFIGEEDRKKMQYGPMYDLFSEAKKLPITKLIILSSDNKAYFFGRYMLYPKLIFIYKPNLSNAEFILVVYPVKKEIVSKLQKDGYSIYKKFEYSNGQLYGFIMKK